jgi:hypothetical protein
MAQLNAPPASRHHRPLAARRGISSVELALIVAVVAVALMVAFRFRPRHDHSPFSIYGVSPGMSLAELTSTVEGHGGKVSCRPEPHLYQTCALKLETDPGIVLTLLDPKSRVIVFHARGVVGMAGFADEADAARAAWGHMALGTPSPPVVELGDTGVVRWMSPDKRWAAELHYAGIGDPDPPMGIVLVDRKAVATYAAHSPQAREEVKRSGWIPPSVADAAAAFENREGDRQSNYQAMSATLSVLRDCETAHYTEHQSYTEDQTQLVGLLVVGNSNLEILTATDSGWTARATSQAIPGISCVAYGGRVPASDWPVTAGGKRITWVEGTACDSMPPLIKPSLGAR